jgi:hypothetical protein
LTIPQSFDFTPPEQLESENLYRNLNEMYEQISTGINGNQKSSFSSAPFLYTPILNGSGVAGTFTYISQNAVVFRMGTLIDLWYEIVWTSKGSATGNLELTLPYKSSLFTGFPFVGGVFTGGINIGAFTGVYLAPNSKSFKGLFWRHTASGTAKSLLPVPGSGNIQGNIRYMATQDGGNL